MQDIKNEHLGQRIRNMLQEQRPRASGNIYHRPEIRQRETNLASQEHQTSSCAKVTDIASRLVAQDLKPGSARHSMWTQIKPLSSSKQTMTSSVDNASKKKDWKNQDQALSLRSHRTRWIAYHISLYACAYSKQMTTSFKFALHIQIIFFPGST